MPRRGRTVKVQGTRELIRGSEKLFAQVGEKAVRGFRRVASQRAGMVAGRMPHRTGRMASAVRPQNRDEGAALGFSRAEVPYGAWVEFGGTRGRPYRKSGRYLFPVAKAARPELESEATQAMQTEIRGFRWPKPR